jgi:hypothetical protein
MLRPNRGEPERFGPPRPSAGAFGAETDRVCEADATASEASGLSDRTDTTDLTDDYETDTHCELPADVQPFFVWGREVCRNDA